MVVDPTARRISGLLGALSELFASRRTGGDWMTRQLKIILDAVREEVEEDITIFGGPQATLWIIDFSKLMEWTATGDYSKLPEHLLPIAYAIDGRQMPQQDQLPFEEPAIAAH